MAAMHARGAPHEMNAEERNCSPDTARYHSRRSAAPLTLRTPHSTPMNPQDPSRRTFLTSSVALAGATLLPDRLAGAAPQRAAPQRAAGPLLAYVGTFSSPLRDVLPTQVDLPPGNGRGIHLFRVDRESGALAAAGVHEMGTSPSCL